MRKGALPKVNSSDNQKKKTIPKRKPSKAKSSAAARRKHKMKGGKVTSSGHTINLTSDEQTAFMKLRVDAVQDIITDSAFTPKQKADLIKKMPSMKDVGFYKFLRQQYRTGPDLAAYITQFVSKGRPDRQGSKNRGTKK